MRKGDRHQKRGQAGNYCLSPFLVPVTFLLILSSCNERPAESPAPKIESAPQITDRIVLTNGGILEGKLVEETQNIVRIELPEGTVGFHPSEIRSVERGISKTSDSSVEGGVYVPTFESEESKKVKWPAGVRHRVLLKNGEWVNGEITQKSDQNLTVRQKLDEGGAIELDLDLNRVEKIDLWPPSELDPRPRFEEFQKKYPSLKLMQKGYYSILTSEQDPLELKYYMKTLDQFYHDFLLHFFELVNLDQIPEPLDVIIFGTQKEFTEVLKEIGFNLKSNPVGFYHYSAKKLVFYNMKTGKDVEAALTKARGFQSEMAKLSSEAEKTYGNEAASYQGAIERATEEAERYELKVLGETSSQNTRIIRHEGGHQLFHLLGITPQNVYAGGWLIEGLAVYCEPDPIGDVQEEKLMQLRYELEKRDLMPLEYLINFARGTGLHKLDPLYANLAYSESWAFVHFLMTQGYQKQFLDFLKEARIQGPEYDSTAEWKLLEKHLGKDIKSIEAEFFPYVRKLVADHIDEKTYENYRLGLIKQFV